jgi:hypothetical protein
MRLIAPLFDLSFSEFITTRVVRFLYAFALLGAAVFSLFLTFGPFLTAEGFFGRTGGLLFGLVVGPIAFLVMSALTRIGFELTIVLFRIAENAQTIAEATRADHPQERIGGTL